MSHLLAVIQRNIDNLKFAIEFDRFDLSVEEQEAMLIKVQQIQEIVDEAKEGRHDKVDNKAVPDWQSKRLA